MVIAVHLVKSAKPNSLKDYPNDNSYDLGSGSIIEKSVTVLALIISNSCVTLTLPFKIIYVVLPKEIF